MFVIEEDMTKTDVQKEITKQFEKELSGRAFSKMVRKICQDTISDIFKTLWQRKSFWR